MKKLIFILSLLFAVPALATDYYVRPAGGSYGLENGTSYADAWDGFGNIAWATVDGGNGTLYVGGANTETMLIGASGEDGTPIIIKGYDNSASLTSIVMSNKSWITIDGLIVTGNTSTTISGIHLSNTCENVVIQNTTSKNHIRNGISADNGSYDGNGSTLTVDNCYLYNNGKNAPAVLRGQGIYFAGNTLVLKNSTVYGNGDIWGAQCDQDHGVYIGEGTNSVDIYNNVVHDTPCGNGIQIKGGQVAANIYNNTIYGNHLSGIRFLENNNLTLNGNVWNNLIYSNGDQAISQINKESGDINLVIYHNSTYQNGTRNDSSWYSEVYFQDQLTSVVMKNNIFYASGTDYLFSSDTTQNLTADYNYYYGGKSSPFRYNGTDRNWSYWTTTLSFDANGGNADPLYVSPPSDMTLSESSPVIDIGVTLSSPYNTDILGTARPSGAAFDLGAYESIIAVHEPGRARFSGGRGKFKTWR